MQENKNIFQKKELEELERIKKEDEEFDKYLAEINTL